MTCEIYYNNAESESTEFADINRPTLVLEAGMGNWSLFYYPLAQELNKFAKICLINRDGYMDSHSVPKDAFSIARQMKAMLELNQINEPLILVGHSLGGLHVLVFNSLFPDSVKGLILLDSAHPKMYDVLPQIKINLEKQIRKVSILILLARLGLLRFAKKNIPTFGLPQSILDQYYNVTTRARYYITYREEMKNFESTLKTGKTLDGLGDLPLLIISSPFGLNKPIKGNPKSDNNVDEAWLSMQEDLINLSSQSSIVTSKGDHFLHLTDTDFVAKTIQVFYEKF